MGVFYAQSNFCNSAKSNQSLNGQNVSYVYILHSGHCFGELACNRMRSENLTSRGTLCNSTKNTLPMYWRCVDFQYAYLGIFFRRVPRRFWNRPKSYFRSGAFKDWGISDRLIWWSEVNPQPIYLLTLLHCECRNIWKRLVKICEENKGGRLITPTNAQ